MKKLMKFGAVISATVILFSQTSCIGSFALTNKVLDFNKNVGDKFLNEVVFLAFCIVPVYEISVFADAVIFNLIEFWTDSNPLAMKDGESSEKTVSIDGVEYKMQATPNKVSLEALTGVTAGKTMEIVFNDVDGMWTMNVENQSINLMQYSEAEQSAIVFMPNGAQYEVSAEENNFQAVAAQVKMHNSNIAFN